MSSGNGGAAGAEADPDRRAEEGQDFLDREDAVAPADVEDDRCRAEFWPVLAAQPAHGRPLGTAGEVARPTLYFPEAAKVLDALRIPHLEKEGYEADDIIATLATQAEDDGFEPAHQRAPGEVWIPRDMMRARLAVWQGGPAPVGGPRGRGPQGGPGAPPLELTGREGGHRAPPD